MRLLLARHGGTLWNELGKLRGQADIPPSDQGRKRAQAMAQALKRESIRVVYCSDLTRAAETAQIIAAELPETTVVQCLELREISLGALEGKTRQEIEKVYPGLFAAQSKNKYYFPFPDGESYADVEERLRPFLEFLRQ